MDPEVDVSRNTDITMNFSETKTRTCLRFIRMSITESGVELDECTRKVNVPHDRLPTGLTTQVII